MWHAAVGLHPATGRVARYSSDQRKALGRLAPVVALQASEALPEDDRDGTRHVLPRSRSQLASKLLGFIVLDVQAHWQTSTITGVDFYPDPQGADSGQRVPHV